MNAQLYMRGEWATRRVSEATPHQLRVNKGYVFFKQPLKVKLSLCLTEHHVMKVYWESGGIVPCILDLSTRGR
jgi:hypothetical protein